MHARNHQDQVNIFAKVPNTPPLWRLFLLEFVPSARGGELRGELSYPGSLRSNCGECSIFSVRSSRKKNITTKHGTVPFVLEMWTLCRMNLSPGFSGMRPSCVGSSGPSLPLKAPRWVRLNRPLERGRGLNGSLSVSSLLSTSWIARGNAVPMEGFSLIIFRCGMRLEARLISGASKALTSPSF
jgi:hypothetical protein